MAMGAGGNGATPEEPSRCSLYANGGGINGVTGGHQSEDNSPDDELAIPSLMVSDLEHNPWSLQGLSKLRRNRQFCDVILQVTNSLPAHTTSDLAFNSIGRADACPFRQNHALSTVPRRIE